MWLLALEAAVALALLLLIVWATIGGRRPREEDEGEGERPSGPPGGPDDRGAGR